MKYFLLPLYIYSLGSSLVSPTTTPKGVAERKRAGEQRHAGAATAASKQRHQRGAIKADQNRGTRSPVESYK